MKNQNKFRIYLVAFFVALIAICALVGCKPVEKIKYIPVVVRHDSIVEKTVRDTVLKYLPQKQSVIAVKNSHLETDLAISNASIDSLGFLHHSIENKGTIPGKVVDTKTAIHDSIPVPYPVEVPGEKVEVSVEVPVHDFIWWIGLIVLLSGIGYGLYKLVTWSPVNSFIKRLFIK